MLAVWFGAVTYRTRPGSRARIGAIPLYLLVRPYGLGAVAATALVVTVVGIWASGAWSAGSASKDPQIVCIDEVAGVLVTWIAAPPTWARHCWWASRCFACSISSSPGRRGAAERRRAAAPASWATTSRRPLGLRRAADRPPARPALNWEPSDGFPSPP